MTPPIVAVDTFAGAGGWSVAARRMGIVEYGVEIMREAVRTRSANGFRTIYRDVWSGMFHPWLVPAHELKISSPPCQPFSKSGNGEGRDALGDIIEAIDDRRYTDPAKLFDLATQLDPRTALVLTPLAHVWTHRPRLVALEQVPEVLPVWHAIAVVLRTLGYSVWTGILRAEQYGVPQTRKRAILMARLDGKVAPPAPTHSRFYETQAHRLDRDVEKWIPMSDALGGPIDGWKWNDTPATTVAGKGEISAREHHYHGEQSKTGLKLTRDQAASLQTFPSDFQWRGGKTKQFLQIGNAVPPLMAEAILGALLGEPAERDAWDLIFAGVAG